MTEVQKARRWVRVRPGEARAAARRAHRANRQAVRRALRAGELDAMPTRPRSIARELA